MNLPQGSFRAFAEEVYADPRDPKCCLCGQPVFEEELVTTAFGVAHEECADVRWEREL